MPGRNKKGSSGQRPGTGRIVGVCTANEGADMTSVDSVGVGRRGGGKGRCSGGGRGRRQ